MKNMTKAPSQLKEERDALDAKDNLAFIRFYEENLNSIEAIATENNIDLYFFKLHLIGEYGMSLSSAGYNKKALPHLKNAIDAFEETYRNNKDELIEITFYQHLLWNYGLTLWHTKELNLAIETFERLVTFYPKNDMFKEWLYSLKKQKIRKFTNPIWYIAGIWLIGEFTFFD